MTLLKIEKKTKPLTIPSKHESRGLKFDSWDFGSYKIPSSFPKLKLTKKEKIKEHNEEFNPQIDEENIEEMIEEENEEV